ncbi:hypothetical protein AB3S75_043565 [Citrus x aurantiifolia]
MEGAIAEGEWSSLSGMYTTDQEADFMAQLLRNCPVSAELEGSSSFGNSSSPTFWPSHGANDYGSYYSLDIGAYSGGGGSSIFSPYSSSQESIYLSESHQILGNNNINDNNINSSTSMDFCMGDANCNTSSYLIDNQGEDECLNNQENNNINDGNKPELGFPVKALDMKNESEMQATEPAVEEKLNNPSESSKKRSRNATDVQKNNKRNVKSKKNQKRDASAISNTEEDNDTNNNENENIKSIVGANRLQLSSSCCSEDESNASQDQIGGEDSSKGKVALNLSGKTRASRGSATDPQSLYARKRRERINERLRILQNLVPNGTKVDISTMLEEAVQYVKFLQLQIKLLSSDDLWMYAPIAYNGMNIGLDHLKLAAASKLS